MCYVWDGSSVGHIDPAEVQTLTPGSSVIDITEDVRQTLLLSVPLKLLGPGNMQGSLSALRQESQRGPLHVHRWHRRFPMGSTAIHSEELRKGM